MAAPTTLARPRRGDELELTVDRLAYGGNGVARREDGYVVFVAGARARRPRARARSASARSAYAEARTVELLEPSPDRIPAVADHPGAPWQVLPYARQLEVKQEQVDDALTRIGRLEGFELEPIVPARRAVALPQQARVLVRHRRRRRARVRLPRARALGPDPADDDCMLASERSNAAREQALAELRRQGLGAWDRRTQQGFLRNLVVREGRRTGELQVRLVTSPGKLDADALIDAVDADGLFWTQTAGLGESTQGGETTLLPGARSCTSSSATCAS